MGAGIIGGSHLLSVLPPPPHPNCQVLSVAQLGSETSGDGEPSQAESGAASQALDGARRRRAVREGSLPPKGQAAPATNGAGEAAREGESTSARDQTGGSWFLDQRVLRRGEYP